jgi:hypothetical protein
MKRTKVVFVATAMALTMSGSVIAVAGTAVAAPEIRATAPGKACKKKGKTKFSSQYGLLTCKKKGKKLKWVASRTSGGMLPPPAPALPSVNGA